MAFVEASGQTVPVRLLSICGA